MLKSSRFKNKSIQNSIFYSNGPFLTSNNTYQRCSYTKLLLLTPVTCISRKSIDFKRTRYLNIQSFNNCFDQYSQYIFQNFPNTNFISLSKTTNNEFTISFNTELLFSKNYWLDNFQNYLIIMQIFPQLKLVKTNNYYDLSITNDAKNTSEFYNTHIEEVQCCNYNPTNPTNHLILNVPTKKYVDISVDNLCNYTLTAGFKFNLQDLNTDQDSYNIIYYLIEELFGEYTISITTQTINETLYIYLVLPLDDQVLHNPNYQELLIDLPYNLN